MEANLSAYVSELADGEFFVPTPVMVNTVFQVLIATAGILCNLMVIVTLLLGSERQDTSSIVFMINLASADFLFLVGVPFQVAEDIYMRWTLGSFACSVSKFVTYLNFMVSPLFLMVMSIDRFLAVNLAFSSGRFRTKRAAKIVSFFVWLISVGCVLPVAAFHSIKNGLPRCSPNFPDEIAPEMSLESVTRSILALDPSNVSFETLNDLFSQNASDQNTTGGSPRVDYCKYSTNSRTFYIWTICNFVYSYVIPFFVISCCYSAILWKVYSSKGMEWHSESVNAHQRHRRRKVTRTVATLVITYAVCSSPYYIWQVAQITGVPVAVISVCAHVKRFNTTMGYFNSALNPFIYAFSSGIFSNKFRIARRQLRRGPTFEMDVTNPTLRIRITPLLDRRSVIEKNSQSPKKSPSSSLRIKALIRGKDATRSPSLKNKV
ncbi:unnamed protein product [Clavelina lepadiformis]